MTARIFAILAAVFLVVSVGIAALTPFGLTLAAGLVAYDGHSLTWMQAHTAASVWNWVEVPFLSRPLWLLPACLGVVCAGLATSFNFGTASPSRRRRS